MAHVFLSYSRDDIEAAKRLTEALEASGIEVWWDRTIPPGKTFDQVIEEALDASAWAIVLWSKSSIESNWVKAEAEEALRRGILVPVLVDDVRPPLAFRRIEAAELQDWDGDPEDPEFQQLLTVMGDDAPPRPAPGPRKRKPRPTPRPTPTPEPIPTPRGMGLGAKLALGAAALVIVVLTTVLLTNRGNQAQDRAQDPPPDTGGSTLEQLRDEPPDEPAHDPAYDSGGKTSSALPYAGKTSPPPKPAPAPQTGAITLQYLGDVYACQLLLQITVGNQTVAPQSNSVFLQNVPLGMVNYSVGGTIGCPGIGVCNAAGAGSLQVVDGGVYNLIWQNTTPGGCGVTLVRAS